MGKLRGNFCPAKVTIVLFLLLGIFVSVDCYCQSIHFTLNSIEGMSAELREQFGKRIRVRITSKRDNSQHETLIFDEERHNAFGTDGGGSGRSFYAKYLDDIQSDSTTNVVILDSLTPEGKISFVTSGDSSDFPNLALGYGLYYINIEFPFESCIPPHELSWSGRTWNIDFRDSRYANQYGIGDQGDLFFEIHLKYKDNEECGPPCIDMYLTTSSRMDSLHLSNQSISADYTNSSVVMINEVFEQAHPEYDFHLTRSVYYGLDTTQSLNLGHSFDLTHSATIDADLALKYNDQFTLSNFYSGIAFDIARDSVIFNLEGSCTVQPVGYSAYFNIAGSSNNPVRVVGSGVQNDPTGFVLCKGMYTDIRDVDLVLEKPIIVNGGGVGRLVLSNSTVLRQEYTGSLIFLEQPYSIRAKNTTIVIDSCIISPIDSTVSQGTGILLDSIRANSRIKFSTVRDFKGHGIEIVNGPPIVDSAGPKASLWLDGNTIRNNRMYGVHIRGARANPYLSSNYIYGNGWFGSNDPAMQSRKFDGVNIQSAAGIFQKNTFDSSGAYGLHAAFNATILSKRDTTIPKIGENCFRRNYFNLGASGASWLFLGEDSASGQNAFACPRATWSDPFHVTLRHTSNASLMGNAWENPALSANPYPISKVDSATSFENPQYLGEPILCTQSLSPGGARSDSIAHGDEIDAIRAAASEEDWITARDLSILLLEANYDAYSTTFSALTLFDALREADDHSIPSVLSAFARDTTKQYTSIAANYSAIKAFAYIMEYDSSLVLANYLAQRFPYSDQWRMANIAAAFIQYDGLGNYYAAEDILLGVLEYYPDDAQAIGAYYSVKGTLPDGFAKGNRKGALDVDADSEDMVFAVFPNPARNEVTVRFVLAVSASVRLSLYDISGNFLQDLYRSGILDAGTHQVTCSLENVPVGYYHVVLRVNGNVVRKLIHIVL